MCLVVYLASRMPLPEIAWTPAAPGFHVKATDDGASRVRGQMASSHVYYMGSHEGCGCGFDPGTANPNHPAEFKATRHTLEALGRYLRAAVAANGEVELYTCWDGDEAVPAEHRLTVSVGFFGPAMAWFPERSHVTVCPDAAA
jgi:hypothetical protein